MKDRNFEKEFSFRMSRSSGKGGQHVNKVNTRVELLFDVFGSEFLDEKEQNLVIQKLAAIISQEGILQITCQETRSQKRNKEIAVEKFYEKLEEALKEEKPRKKTKKPKSLNEKRLKEKKIQAEKKRLDKRLILTKINLFFISSVIRYEPPVTNY